MHYRDVSDDPAAQALAAYPELVQRLMDLDFVWVGLVRLDAGPQEDAGALYDDEDRVWFRRNRVAPSNVLLSPDGHTVVDISNWWGDEPSIRMRTQLESGAVCETLRAIERMPNMVEAHDALRETGRQRQQRGHTPNGGRSIQRVVTDDPGVVWAGHQAHLEQFLARHPQPPRPLSTWEDYARICRVCTEHDKASMMATGRATLFGMVAVGLLVAALAVPLSSLLGAIVGVGWLLGMGWVVGTRLPDLATRAARAMEPLLTPDLADWSGDTEARRQRRRAVAVGLRGALLVGVALLALVPTLWIALTRMPGGFEPQEPSAVQLEMAQRIERALPTLLQPVDLVPLWAERGWQAQVEGGRVTLSLGEGEALPVVLWTGPEVPQGTLAVLSELPGQLMELGAGRLVVAVGAAASEVPEGRRIQLGDLTLGTQAAKGWPLAPAWAEPGSQLQLNGSWGARNLVRALAREGRAVGAVPVQGLLRLDDWEGQRHSVAGLQNRGAWVPESLVEPDPVRLAQATQAVGAMTDGLLMSTEVPVGWFTWRTALALISGGVMLYLGRLIWGLLEMGEAMLEGHDEHSLEALGPSGRVVEASLRDGRLDALITALEQAELPDRYVWLDLLAERAPASQVQAWVEREPDNLLAQELQAWTSFASARDLVGHGPHTELDDGVLELQRSEVARSREALDMAQGLQPGLGAHHGLRLALASLVLDPWPHQLALFDAGVGEDPTSYGLWQSMMSASSDQFGAGSPELQRLAREGSKGAAKGSPLWALVAQAHVVRFENLCDQGVEDPEEYLLDPSVIGELQHAFDQFHEGGPRGPEAALAYGWFRTAFAELEEPERFEAALFGSTGP